MAAPSKPNPTRPEAAPGRPLPSLPVHRGIYTVRALARYPELLHAISTRTSPAGDDWNLTGKRGSPQHPADWGRALANRAQLAAHLGVPLGRMVGCRQVHGAVVARVGDGDAGKGMTPDTPPVEGADALVTDTPDLYLLALSADCPPVFFYDPRRRAIGLAHSGWKGTVARIAANVVREMHECFGSDPADIIASIGPGIGQCCYAVGQNVVEAVEAAFPGPWDAPGTADGHAPLLVRQEDNVYFNLQGAIRLALLDAGVPPANISCEDVCTAHNLGTFYSHRAEAGMCGLFGAVLGLRPA